MLHGLVAKAGISLSGGCSSSNGVAADAHTRVQFCDGWRWLRSWSAKDDVVRQRKRLRWL